MSVLFYVNTVGKAKKCNQIAPFTEKTAARESAAVLVMSRLFIIIVYYNFVTLAACIPRAPSVKS